MYSPHDGSPILRRHIGFALASVGLLVFVLFHTHHTAREPIPSAQFSSEVSIGDLIKELDALEEVDFELSEQADGVGSR